ncbi:TlpA family protein disulfide reductase [Nocardioides sp.]|uniref:TlpA family protein disulfide reductase n=1 Tax=Nocardioides sp. TaxID=35761 RepID=UPI00352843B7
MRIGRLLLGVLLAATLAGCASDQGPGLIAGGSGVDVDTPQLRALKKQAGIADCSPGQGVAVDGGLPDVTLPCLGGGPDVPLGTLRGPMVVNVWASWCPPCREELPVYQRFAEEYAGRVAVVGIDFQDTQPRAALELARDAGVTYPLLADPESLTEGPPPGLVARGLPMVALVDAEGEVVHLEAREVTDVRELQELVSTYLDIDGPAS